MAFQDRLGFVLGADLGKFKSVASKGKNRSKVIGKVGRSVLFGRNRPELKKLFIFTKAEDF